MKDGLHSKLSYAAAALSLLLCVTVFFSLTYAERADEAAVSAPSKTAEYSASTGAYTFVFDFDEIPSQPMAVQFFSEDTPVEIQFNSSSLPVSRSQDSPSFLLPAARHNTSVQIPKNYFLPGINELAVFFEEGGDADFGSVAIRREGQAERVFAVQDRLNWLMPRLAIASGALAVLFSIIGLVLGQQRQEYVPLLALGVTVLLVGVLSNGASTIGASTLSAGLLILAQAGMLLFSGFGNGAFDRSHSPLDKAALGIALFSIVVSAWVLAFGPQLFGALFSYCAGLAGSVLFILCRLSKLIAQDITRFRRTVSELERTVSKQAIQLDEKSEVIAKGMVRNAILEERQRMMRDIHDGIGSQLLSLMLRVKSGKISNRETTSGIKQSLTDLRLVVDSADHLGGDLAAAFTTFRSRALQQFNAANIQMHWHLSEDLLGQFKSTGKTLDVYRFMQEVVANVIRHSGAKSATFNLSLDREEGQLLLEIADDGIGLPPAEERKEGKGLRNLAKRAKLLGAGYSIGRGPNGSGTIVTLRLNPAQFPSSDHSLIQPS